VRHRRLVVICRLCTQLLQDLGRPFQGEAVGVEGTRHPARPLLRDAARPGLTYQAVIGAVVVVAAAVEGVGVVVEEAGVFAAGTTVVKV
jgi:hypothetical protein